MRLHVDKTSWLLGALLALSSFISACGDDSGPDGGPDTGVLDGGIMDTGMADGGPDGFVPTPAEFTIDPTLQDYGSVAVGAMSSEVMFTVTNTGMADSTAITATLSNPTDFEMTMDGCSGMTLAPAATCTIAALFKPQSEGDKTSTLTVTAGTATASATLEGTGTMAGLSISPTPHNFGSVDLGMTSADQTFTVSNTGTATTGTISVSLTGTDATHFEIVTDDCTGMTLDMGASCDVVARYNPTAAGTHMATLEATADPGGTAMSSLTGTAVQPANLVIAPSVQDFGSVGVGMSSSDITFMVSNTGGAASGTISHSFGGTDAGDFAVVSSTCMGVPLAGGASCNIVVHFTPTSTGAKSATLDVTGSPGGTPSADLSGTGTMATLSITPTPHDFGTVSTGMMSAAQTFTVTNGGSGTTGALAVAIAGSHPADFPIVSGTDSCSGRTLPPAGTCTIAVQFRPSAAGARSASLTVNGTPGGTASAALSGNGETPANFELTPATGDFGSVATGATSSDIIFTVRNIGGAMSGRPMATLRGAQASQFQIAADGCTAGLAAGASCTITLRFRPTTTGTKVATLEVMGIPGSTETSDLTGIGITPPNISISPSPVVFPDTVEGLTSGTRTFTVTNSGMATTGSLSTALTGADPGEFTIVTDNCDSMTLASGATCTIIVRFSPGSVGDKAASLDVTDPAVPATASAAISGTATDDIDVCWGGMTSAECTPNPFDYGSVRVGDTDTQSFTVINRGTARTFNAATLAGPDAGQFTIITDGCDGTMLAVDGTCTISVRFSPAGMSGARNARLRVSASGGAVTVLDLDGMAGGQISFISPALPYDFGSVRTGTTSTQTFTARNDGGTASPLIATSFSFSGDYAIVSDSCAGTSLAAGGMCAIDVLFYPQTTGATSGSVTITYGSNSATANFTGTGTPGAQLSIMPGSRSFGTIRATETASRTFTISNTGGFVTGTLSMGGLAAPFSISGGTCPTADMMLDPGESCTIQVEFAPQKTDAPGDFSDTLNVAATPGGAVSGGVSGTMVSMLSVMPGMRTYPNTEIGDTSTTTTFTITNNGGVATGSIQATRGGSNPGQFTTTSNTCTTLAPGATCTVGIAFAPTAIGTWTTELRVSDGVFGTNPGATVIAAPLRGTGLAPASLSIDPTSKAYGAVLRLSNSAPFTFTVTNSGGVPTGTLTSTATDDFNITANTCTGTLGAGASCTVSVRFSPTTLGAHTGTITVGDGSISAVASLTGTGNGGSSITITPSPYDFGDAVAGGSPSAYHTFTATNNSTSATGTLTTSVTGRFTLGTDNCTGASLAGGGSCTFQVRFAPMGGDAGFLEGTASVGSGTAALSGTALSPAALDLQPSSWAYADTATGGSTPHTFTLTNTGGLATAALSVSLSGADFGHYSISMNTCTGTLAGGASCTFVVSFAPSTAGTKTATVTADDGTVSDSSSLSGTAVLDATLGITPSATQNCGSHVAGTSTVCRSFTVTNGGDLPSGNLVDSLTNEDDFTRTGGTCPAGTLGAGASCTIEISYTPQTVGSHTTRLSVTAAPGGTVNVNLNGTGTTALSISGTSAFGMVDVGSSSSIHTFTVTNASGSGSTGVLVATITGAANADYDVTEDNCTGAPLAAAGTCTIDIRLVPSATGARNANLRVTDGTAEKLAVQALTGTGTTP